MQVMKTRALTLAAATTMGVAGLLAGGVATAGANCLAPVVSIQSPLASAPTAGNVTVQATADSGTPVTAASLTVLDNADVTVGGTPVLATVGATAGGAPTVYPITAAFDTRALADGQYTFEVSASGVCPPGKAQVKILVDNTKPSLSFTSGPAEGEALANGATPTFGFAAAADLTGPVTFQCAYDAAALAACGSPSPATTLNPGTHSFRVVGTDGAGNSSSITRSFSVALPPPVDASSSGDQPKQKPSCRVPRLRGLTLAAARSKLRRAHCRLGRVSKPPKRVLALALNRGQKLVVQKQSERAGAKKPNGQRVGVALVPKRDLKLS